LVELAAGSFLVLEPLLDESDDEDEPASEELFSLDEPFSLDELVGVVDVFEPLRLSVL